ncbi:unnamed protein product [Strongylus vulgaris]|uniref:Uncharacterized protein n=1 Tax=Strongylus vulgaris TaxID=40348 RepID=A0A3P7IWS4_STRVU|nr:unnamed protein product [Strongylus vulgaris]
MSKKSSTVDPPRKKISLISLSGNETPPRKKSNIQLEMSKKSSTVDPPRKKISLISLSGNETPPRKKSSLKENFSNLMRAPNFLIKREAAKKRWNQVCENLHLGRIKVAVTESKLFSPDGPKYERRSCSLCGEL